ncbi:MAG TPA: hypothetical protein VE444_10020, partial [Gaiellaceae bacterium]|nr:hypothetical protein [Gaiellaceae bacterium]
REATLADVPAQLSLEGRRLALASILARHCIARVPVGPAAPGALLAAARSLADDGALGERHDVRFEPSFPGATAGVEGRRIVLACELAELDGSPIGTAFTTLIAGRPPTVSVAPPGTVGGDGWTPLLH